MERDPDRPTLDELRSVTFDTLDEAEVYFNEHGFAVVPGFRPWELRLPDDMQALTCRSGERFDLSGAGIALIFSGSVEAYRKIDACDPTSLRANPGGSQKVPYAPGPFYNGIPGGHLLH